MLTNVFRFFGGCAFSATCDRETEPDGTPVYTTRIEWCTNMCWTG